MVYANFADLAAALCPNDAQKGERLAAAVIGQTVFGQVEEKVGRKAALIWALINNEETTKRSGPNGDILFDAEWIQRRTGFTADVVATSAFNLIRHGFARPCRGGSALKAA